MQIFIRCLNEYYRTITISCDDTITVLDLKKMIQDRLGETDELYQRYSLIFNCKHLDNTKTLKDIGIGKEMLLQLKYMWQKQQ